jgi:hypothetical protein
MNRKFDLKVNQVVFVKIEKGSNAARRMDMTLDNIDEWCFSGIVSKVGKKYMAIDIENIGLEQFSIEDDYKQKYTRGGADYKLYLTKEDAIEEVERDILYSNISREFSGYENKFSVGQLRKINDIINPK